MATSGTTSFNSTVNDIIEDAYELVGGDFITGYDAKMARRFLNMLLIDLQNRNHPLGKLEEVTVTCATGTSDYTLNASIIDVMNATSRRDDIDLPLKRISLFEYANIPVKQQQGRPFQFTTDRDRDSVILKVWPTAENSTDEIKLWTVKKIEDVTNSRQTVDLSTRFQPAIVFGLAYFMSFKRQDMDVNKRAELKQTYMELLDAAFIEDRERTSIFARPVLNRP